MTVALKPFKKHNSYCTDIFRMVFIHILYTLSCS